jgi:hypothetical protein
MMKTTAIVRMNAMINTTGIINATDIPFSTVDLAPVSVTPRVPAADRIGGDFDADAATVLPWDADSEAPGVGDPLTLIDLDLLGEGD